MLFILDFHNSISFFTRQFVKTNYSPNIQLEFEIQILILGIRHLLGGFIDKIWENSYTGS